MATIVVHRSTRKHYILIGTGYGAYKSQLPGVFGGSMFPNEQSGEIPVAAVSDENGQIQWIMTDELQVVEVDGKRITDVLQRYTNHDDGNDSPSSDDIIWEQCPACLCAVKSDASQCPDCGLTLIEEEV